MQIKLDLKTIMFIFIFFVLRKEKLYLIFLIYAIVHELIHMITGIVLGMKPYVLTIMPFGASISFHTDINSYNKKILNGSMSNIKKMLVAILAPSLNFIIGILFSFKSEYILFTYVNIILALFNLLPIYPLDGGRGIREFLTIIFGRRKSLRYTERISNIALLMLIISSLIFCYINRSLLILISIIYLIYIRKKENEIYKIRERAYKILQNDII